MEIESVEVDTGAVLNLQPSIVLKDKSKGGASGLIYLDSDSNSVPWWQKVTNNQ